MTTIRKQIAEVATDIVKAHPGGIRWSELHRAVAKQLPDLNRHTLHGSLHHFANHLPCDVHKPERGVYSFGGQEQPSVAVATNDAPRSKSKENDFYQSFADWLVAEVEEATIAVPLGGSGIGGKWGTPDVIGLYKPRKTDSVQFTEEVIAAEIKVDTSSLIVAFGQACAYKLFAHRVYIVVPSTAPDKDLRRLDALAAVVGIGLVKFNSEDPQNPNFTVMARAAKHEPDYFYTNQTLDKCKELLGL